MGGVSVVSGIPGGELVGNVSGPFTASVAIIAIASGGVVHAYGNQLPTLVAGGIIVLAGFGLATVAYLHRHN